MTEKKDKTKTLNKIKKNKSKIVQIILILLGLGLIVGAYFASNYLKDQKVIVKRKKILEKQNNIMKDFWEKQGLSEEEIQEKMKSGRGNFNRDEITDEMREEMKKEKESGGFNPGVVRGTIMKSH